MLNEYHYDEFVAMMDEYNDMHRLDKDEDKDEEVFAEDF